jgi:hypothetical protein
VLGKAKRKSLAATSITAYPCGSSLRGLCAMSDPSTRIELTARSAFYWNWNSRWLWW